MIVLAYLGSQCTKFYAAGWLADLLCPFIWSRCNFAMDLTNKQWVCIKFCANLRKSAIETLEVIRQVFGEENRSCTWKVQTRRDLKRWDRLRVKSRAFSSFSMTSQRIRPGNPNSQLCILLWHFMVTVWKCVKSSPWTLVTKDLAVACLTLPFSSGNSWPKTWLSSPTHLTRLT
jgi:hypothetical protein